jgi:hypothetical protein
MFSTEPAAGPNWGLAHLGMGPAYGLSHETKRAQTEYEAFFSLWKDADSDLPILRQVRMEYAKLR